MSLIQAYFFQSLSGKKSTWIIHTLTLRNMILFFRMNRLEKYPPGLFILKTFFNMEYVDLELIMTGSMESRAYLENQTLRCWLHCVFHTF